MNYLTSHGKNILSEKSVSKSNLEPGCIISFTYIDEKKVVTKQVVLVLNPSWRNNLHGLTLEGIPEPVLQKLAEAIKLRYSARLQEITKLRLPLLHANVGNPKTFYESSIKPNLGRMLQGEKVYREFKLNRMSVVKIIDYRYDYQDKVDTMIEEQRLRDEIALMKGEGKMKGVRVT